jgi:hypothetical protein
MTVKNTVTVKYNDCKMTVIKLKQNENCKKLQLYLRKPFSETQTHSFTYTKSLHRFWNYNDAPNCLFTCQTVCLLWWCQTVCLHDNYNDYKVINFKLC